MPLAQLHLANVLKQLSEHTGTARFFKQTTEKAVYMLRLSKELTLDQWRHKANSACYLSDVVGDPVSLETWKKSCAILLYVHLFDLHAAITEVSKTCCNSYNEKAINPPDLAGMFYLFLRNHNEGGDFEHDITMGTPLHQDGGSSMISLHTCLIGTNLVNLYELCDCQLRLIKATQHELQLDGALAMNCEGFLLQKVTPYSVPRTMIIIHTWSLHI